MRTLTSVICWVIAVLAGIVALPVTWIADNVAEETGYVELVRDLRDDPRVVEAVADTAASRVAGDLPEAVRDQVAAQLSQALGALEEVPGFDEAWDDSQRRSHQLWFGGRYIPEQLQVDVTPLVDLALQQVTTALPIAIESPEEVRVPVATAPPGLRFVETTPTWKSITLLAAGAAAVLCFVFARHRSTGLAWIGVGALVIAGVTYVGTRVTVPAVLDGAASGSSQFGQVLTDAVGDRFTASLDGWVEQLALAGGAAIVLGLVCRGILALWRRRRRSA
ncbi:hypothetical protein [Aeromicrobium piscarium]|uniref:Uncharacterized protein n=1 Tax=Aeromicrobium piscarium TaxID=2590901 RepID=A0A554SD26_9ACTN|nr:hypothetical protein [Aeromicrobium piscarium]TSD64250.1 hypothetical protein FNM00_06785 [Aeromicrobium piscarium]